MQQAVCLYQLLRMGRAFHTEVVLGEELNELPFLLDVSVTVFSKRSWAVVLVTFWRDGMEGGCLSSCWCRMLLSVAD